MYTEDTDERPWLPTTKTQSVVVVGLNLLLLFNLTVIVVLLADSGLMDWAQGEVSLDEVPVANHSAQADRDLFERADTRDRDEVLFEPATVLADADEAGQSPVADVSVNASIGTAPETIEIDLPQLGAGTEPVAESSSAEPAHPEIEAETDEPPIEFFGVEVE